MTVNETHLLVKTLHERFEIPAHPPRTASAEFEAIRHRMIVEEDQPCFICLVRQSTLHDPAHNKRGATQMELHHCWIEWALANAIDLDKFNAQIVARYRRWGVPGYETDYTQQQMLDWIDHGEQNMLPLCMPGDVPVLMSDGKNRALADVRIRDAVIGHDGRAHHVTARMNRHFDGDLVLINGRPMTPNHPVLTLRGWVPAGALRLGDLTLNIRVGTSQVLNLGSEQHQVLDPIVGSVPIDVMDDLFPIQTSPEMLFHDIAMLTDREPFPVTPDPAHDVAFAIHGGIQETVTSQSRQFIQRSQPTFVGAKTLVTSAYSSSYRSSAAFASNEFRPNSNRSLSPDRAAFVRTRRVARLQGWGNQKRFPADNTVRDNPLQVILSARWSPVDHLDSLLHTGKVYDIAVEDSRSFVANGLVVHNCDVDHRHVDYGVHEVDGPSWLAQLCVKDDFHYEAQP